jgi:hypothetical protein
MNSVHGSFGNDVDANQVYMIASELSAFVAAIPGPTLNDVAFSNPLMLRAKQASHSFTDAAFLETWAEVEPRLTAELLETVLA